MKPRRPRVTLEYELATTLGAAQSPLRSNALNSEGFRFHYLRHEDTIRVFEKYNLPPNFVQRITGHKTISILPGRRASALTS